MIMGDGNHSLAAAKSYWDEIKQNLSASEQESHPARYALLEVNNLYDPAISFEAIHRVVFDVSVEKFVSAFSNALTKTIDGDNEYSLQVISSDNSDKTGKTGDGSLSYSSAARLRCVPCLVKASSTSELITKVQEFLDDYIDREGGKIDYIHDEDVVRKLAKEKNCVGILLPTVSKPEFFKTVSANGVFPRKSFSVGHARDKRYYMECRKII